MKHRDTVRATTQGYETGPEGYTSFAGLVHFITFKYVIKVNDLGFCLTEHVAVQSLVHDCTFPLNGMGSLKLIRK